MLRTQVRIPFYHPTRSPTTQALQLIHPRAILNMPACQGMPQIVTSEICNTGTLQRITPHLTIGPIHRLTRPGKNTYRMLAYLLIQYRQGLLIQRHSDRLTGFGMHGLNPHMSSRKIDLLPFQLKHIPITSPVHKLKTTMSLMYSGSSLSKA